MKAARPVSILMFALASAGPGRGDDEHPPIIVTATRSPLPIREYAGSVEVLDKERLDEIAAVHPAEALNEVAGVNIHRGSGQEHLTAIRSPVLTGGAGAGSFLYLEDGVPLRAAGFANVNGLFESMIELADRVEVTKGPGSVLYGSNAVHGLINILSPAPDKGFSFDIIGNEDGYARLKLAKGAGFLNGRIGLATSLTSDPGFRADSGFDQQKVQIRHDMQKGKWRFKSIASFQNLNQETAGFVRGPDAYKNPVLARGNDFPEAFRDGKTARFAVHMKRATGGGSTLSLIPYVRWVDLSFLRHFVPGQANEDSGHKSIGLLTSHKGTLKNSQYIIGLDSEFTRGFVREFQNGPRVFSFIQGEHYDYHVNASVISPYLQTRHDLSRNTKLTLGARADYTFYDYRNNINNGSFGRFLRINDRQDDYLTITPKIGLTHEVNQNISLYSRLARGSRAPQITDLYSLQINQRAGEIKAEKLDSLEAGMKGNLSGIRFEAAAFLMRKNNFYFRNANGFNVSDGKTRHKGVEVSFAAPLGRHFDLSGAFTLASHTYAFSDIVSSPSSSINKGNQVDSAPKTLGQLQLALRPTIRSSLSVKWQHVGKYFTDPGNTARYPGHDVFTLRSHFVLSDKITIYGRIDNVLNTRYADRADFAFGTERYFPARPRTLFFGLRFKS